MPRPTFSDRLAAAGDPFERTGLDVVQVNLGKVCNQTCRHCHVDASPFRTERMSEATVDDVLAFLARSGARTLDVTGGAPELHPSFRRLVRAARALGVEVIDRCNLTILLEPGHDDLAAFLAEQRVHVIASLPCWLERNVDLQRGTGVHARSLRGLQRLNALGYGRRDDLRLDLVYNPGGPTLPPPQADLEASYRRELDARYGVAFHRLLTLTNMPLARFAGDLRRQGRLEAYQDLLVQAFNPATLPEVMCRSLVSIGWDGRVFDCDFHQMSELPLADEGRLLHVAELSRERLVGRPVVRAEHCYGCTAGAGSSCGGALA